MIYCIASCMMEVEYLVVKDQSPFGVFSFLTLKQAESVLKIYYDVMCSADVTATLYEQTKATLLKVNPVIVGVPGTPLQALKTISKWGQGRMTFTCSQPIISEQHLVVPVKKGFIKAYQKVDVVKDIEQKMNIVLRMNLN